MAKTLTPQPELTEAQTVDDWRCDELTAAGYPVEIAQLIALDHTIDLHQACDLLARGCPLPTAIKILL